MHDGQATVAEEADPLGLALVCIIQQAGPRAVEDAAVAEDLQITHVEGQPHRYLSPTGAAYRQNGRAIDRYTRSDAQCRKRGLPKRRPAPRCRYSGLDAKNVTCRAGGADLLNVLHEGGVAQVSVAADAHGDRVKVHGFCDYIVVIDVEE